MANKNDNNTLILAGAGMLMFYFGLLRPLTDALGLTKDAEEQKKALALEQLSKLNGWDPNFYLQYKKLPSNYPISFLTEAVRTTLAKQINSAWGRLNDKEELIYATFRQVKSQVQLSQLAEKYYQLYKKDLQQDIKQKYYYGLNPSELEIVASIVNKLPVSIPLKR